MSDASSQIEELAAGAPRYQPLVVVLAAACVGVVADRMAGPAVGVWWAVAAAAWVVWLGLWRRRCEGIAAAMLLLSVASTAAAWHHCRWHLFANDDLGCYARGASQPACLQAVALNGPRRLPAPDPDPMQLIPVGDRTRVEVEVTRLRDGANWRAVCGRARLTVDGHLLGVHAGDRLRIFAQLTRPRPATNPGEFDYARFARTDRKRALLRAECPDCVTVVHRAIRRGPAGWIETMRSAGNRLLWKYLDHRRAGLAAAVLLGTREELGIERSRAFRETGTAHLLAISGLHVGIAAWVLFLLMRLMLVRRNRALLVVAAFTVLYTVLTDARPPALRAMILVLVMCSSYYLGRRPLPFNTLAAAGLVVFVLNPADLFSTGAQLSFLAVAGIMWFAPRWAGWRAEKDLLDRMVMGSRPWPARTARLVWRGARHLTVVSATIWLLALPLLMARFHLFTPVAVPLNTFLWIPMAVGLTSGFGVLAFGPLLPPLGAMFGWLCDGSLWLLQSCIEAARDLPGSHFWVPGPADWWLLGFYGGLGVLAAFPAVRPPRRWCLALLAGWSAVGFAAGSVGRDNPQLDCTFLSVGHGCAVVMELPSGQTMLYDAGQFSSPVSGARSIAGCLWSRGITHLDAVVISHSDADHYNALPRLLEMFSVGAIYVSPVMFEEQNPAMDALAEAIQQSEVPLREIYAGDRLPAGDGCLIEVLYPTRRAWPGNDNANSIVLAVEYRGRRILLPGDLEPPGLDDVLAEEPWDCDVLMAPHHGSRRSDPPGLAAWCTPEWVVISGGRRWYRPETAAAYRAAGSRVLHTPKAGAVHVTIDEDGLSVESFLQPDGTP